MRSDRVRRPGHAEGPHPLSRALPATPPRVGVVMGSRSDWETMRFAAQILDRLDIPHETRVVSAHRTPEQLFEYADQAAERGLEVIVAGAGGAAHLPGMLAARTWLPVLGVPVRSSSLNGLDSLLSIVQMPRGVPVGTLAIGEAGATNAALLAASMLAVRCPVVREALQRYRADQTRAVLADPDPSLPPGRGPDDARAACGSAAPGAGASR